MNDEKYIITGLIIFLVILTFPFWFNRGKAAPAPELELTAKAKAAKECIRSTDYMQSEHMQLLDLWRHTVVRNAVPVTPFGDLVFGVLVFAYVNEDVLAIREEDPNGGPVLLVIVFVGKTENLRLRRRLPPREGHHAGVAHIDDAIPGRGGVSRLGGAVVAEITECHG